MQATLSHSLRIDAHLQRDYIYNPAVKVALITAAISLLVGAIFIVLGSLHISEARLAFLAIPCGVISGSLSLFAYKKVKSRAADYFNYIKPNLVKEAERDDLNKANEERITYRKAELLIERNTLTSELPSGVTSLLLKQAFNKLAYRRIPIYLYKHHSAILKSLQDHGVITEEAYAFIIKVNNDYQKAREKADKYIEHYNNYYQELSRLEENNAAALEEEMALFCPKSKGTVQQEWEKITQHLEKRFNMSRLYLENNIKSLGIRIDKCLETIDEEYTASLAKILP